MIPIGFSVIKRRLDKKRAERYKKDKDQRQKSVNNHPGRNFLLLINIPSVGIVKWASSERTTQIPKYERRREVLRSV